MNIGLQESGGRVRIQAGGELDPSGAAELRAALLQTLASSGNPVLDLGAAESIDLSCLQLIVAANRALGARKRRLELRDPRCVFVNAARDCGFSPADLPMGTGTGMSKTILTVDDSVSVRQMVSFTLKGAGYGVIEACDGRDA